MGFFIPVQLLGPLERAGFFISLHLGLGSSFSSYSRRRNRSWFFDRPFFGPAGLRNNRLGEFLLVEPGVEGD